MSAQLPLPTTCPSMRVTIFETMQYFVIPPLNPVIQFYSALARQFSKKKFENIFKASPAQSNP